MRPHLFQFQIARHDCILCQHSKPNWLNATQMILAGTYCNEQGQPWGTGRRTFTPGLCSAINLFRSCGFGCCWWFWMLLVVSLVLSITGAEVYHDQLQLPWRWVLMGFAIDTVFALPLGVLVATANQVNSSCVMKESISSILTTETKFLRFIWNEVNWIRFMQTWKLHQIKRSRAGIMLIASMFSCTGTRY